MRPSTAKQKPTDVEECRTSHAAQSSLRLGSYFFQLVVLGVVIAGNICWTFHPGKKVFAVAPETSSDEEARAEFDRKKPVESTSDMPRLVRLSAKPPADPETETFARETIPARLKRLDEAFGQLMTDLLEIRQLEQARLAHCRAIAMGRLQLRASADPASHNLIHFVYVPAGHFLMGQTESERRESNRAATAAHYDFSYPAHPIHIQNGYFISVYEVTMRQLAEFLATRGAATAEAGGGNPNLPAHSVDWKTAMEFCLWLSQLNSLDVRLPTEIEWEYAARGNSYIQQLETLREREVRFGGPWPVDSRALDRSWCGAVGLGSNLSEWTIDTWDQRAYSTRATALTPEAPVFTYQGFDQRSPSGDFSRVVRGPNFRDAAGNQNPALRRFKLSSAREDTLGIRLVVPVQLESKN